MAVRLSAVIVAWNEAEFIEPTVVGLARLVDEIVLVDNGSTDGTIVLAQNAAHAAGCKLVVVKDLREFWLNEVALWQAGIDAAEGEYLALVDAANIFCTSLPADTLQKLLDQVNASGGVCVQGRYRFGALDHTALMERGWVKTAVMFRRGTTWVTRADHTGKGNFWGGYPTTWPRVQIALSSECGKCRSNKRLLASHDRMHQALFGSRVTMPEHRYCDFWRLPHHDPIAVRFEPAYMPAQLAQFDVPQHALVLGDDGTIRTRNQMGGVKWQP